MNIANRFSRLPFRFVLLASVFLFGACGESTGDGNGSTDGLRTQPVSDRDPGAVTMRRLNRAEYNNTVRDLLGTSLRPADDFPPDDTGFGFDNNGDVLSMSPLHLELYERGADMLVKDIMRPVLNEPVFAQVEVEQIGAEEGAPYQGIGWMLWTEASVGAEVLAPRSGVYRVSVSALADEVGDDAALMNVVVDGNPVARFEVSDPAVFELELKLDEGKHNIAAGFLNPWLDDTGEQRRALVVDWLSLEGPVNLPEPALQPRSQVMICQPEMAGAGSEDGEGVEDEACARQIIERFATRAWRRPVTDGEMEELMAVVNGAADRGRDFETRVGIGLKAILMSPRFLFRPELTGLSDSDTEPVLLDDYDYASRLSYFLWSSMPDEELLAAAERGLINNEEEIVQQVRRMLDDPKAEALVQNFGGQWLYIRDVENVFPDVWIFPDFDPALQEAMQDEMEHFFRTFVFEDRSMIELLTAQEVWVNDRLAEHYGVPYEGDGGFVRVPLEEGHPRTGVMTSAGLLTVLSAPHRTSIVRRGKWILEQMLCKPPPDPPPGVEGLPEDEMENDEPLTGTLRERMEQHSEDPACYACHAEMDPLGFSLENFDGIGGWREMDGKNPVDAFGEFPDGRSFNGALEMQAMLAEDPQYPHCVTEQVMTYALGRGVTGKDREVRNEISEQFAASDYRFEALAIGIALSDPFRFNRVREQEVQ